MSGPLNHLIRTKHHDTGAADMFCGESRDRYIEPTPGAPVCTNCIVAALESSNDQGNKAVAELADKIRKGYGTDWRRILGWVDDITLRLELLEKRADKAERKAAKKRGKR